MTGRLLDEVDFAGRGLEIIGYIDNDSDVRVYGGASVYRPPELKELAYDAVIVPILQSAEVHKQVKLRKSCQFVSQYDTTSGA